MMRACLPDMPAQGSGSITMISTSPASPGCTGVAYDAAYTASKHALVGVARSLALEYGKRGLTVTALCRSFVDGDMLV